MFHENKISKFTEFGFFLLMPFVLFFHMQGATIRPYGSPILFLGAFFFLIAKLSVLKQGHYFTFGCDNMTNPMMASYVLGYFLMIVGYLITFSVI